MLLEINTTKLHNNKANFVLKSHYKIWDIFCHSYIDSMYDTFVWVCDIGAQLTWLAYGTFYVN